MLGDNCGNWKNMLPSPISQKGGVLFIRNADFRVFGGKQEVTPVVRQRKTGWSTGAQTQTPTHAANIPYGSKSVNARVVFLPLYWWSFPCPRRKKE